MMGCSISSFSSGRASFQAKLRPLLLLGLAGVRTWKWLPHRSSTKKSLTMHDPKNSVPMATVIGNTYGIKVATKRPNLRLRSKKRPIKKLDEDDQDDDDQGRNIGAFPGSPSFRIFFEDAANNQIGENHDDAVTNDTSQLPQKNSKLKREGKKLRANIKKVMSRKRTS